MILHTYELVPRDQGFVGSLILLFISPESFPRSNLGGRSFVKKLIFFFLSFHFLFQNFSDDDDGLLDTTADDVFIGKDLQGIPWATTPWTRASYRVSKKS